MENGTTPSLHGPDAHAGLFVYVIYAQSLSSAAADLVAMQRFRIGSGEQQVRVVTRQKPLYAGIDPYISFIDRNSNDNIVQIVDSTRTLP